MQMLKTLFWLCCLFISAAPLHAQGNPRDFEKKGPAAEREMYYAQVRHDVNQLLARFKDVWHRDDARALAALYTEDAGYHPPGHDAVHARPGLAAYFNGFLPNAGAIEMQMLDFGTSGDLAHVTTRVTYFSQQGGEPGRHVVRTDMMVMRRGRNGWLIQSHLARLEADEKPQP